MAPTRRDLTWALLAVTLLVVLGITAFNPFCSVGGRGSRQSLLRRVDGTGGDVREAALTSHTRSLRMCGSFAASFDQMPNNDVIHRYGDWGDCVRVATAVVLRQSVRPLTSQPNDMVFLTTLAQVRTQATFVAFGPTRTGDLMFPIAAATKIKPLHTADVDRSTSSHRNRERHGADKSLGHNRVRKRAASVP